MLRREGNRRNTAIKFDEKRKKYQRLQKWKTFDWGRKLMKGSKNFSSN